MICWWSRKISCLNRFNNVHKNLLLKAIWLQLQIYWFYENSSISCLEILEPDPKIGRWFTVKEGYNWIHWLLAIAWLNLEKIAAASSLLLCHVKGLPEKPRSRGLLALIKLLNLVELLLLVDNFSSGEDILLKSPIMIQGFDCLSLIFRICSYKDSWRRWWG